MVRQRYYQSPLSWHYWRLLFRFAQWAAAIILSLTVLPAYAQEYGKAIVEPIDVEHAISLAKKLDSRKYLPIPQNEAWFEIKKGTSPVIVTAPHATQPFREGEYRFSDGGGTAGLVTALHEICDVTVVYTTYDSPSDPSFYDDNEFKTALGRLINEIKPLLLLDVHASSPYRPYEVDIGTMNGNSLAGNKMLVPTLTDAFSKEGILNISIDRFSASNNQTITKYASSKGVPSMQLELSATRVSPTDNDLAAHRFAQTIQALALFLGKQGQCARINNKSIKN